MLNQDVGKSPQKIFDGWMLKHTKSPIFSIVIFAATLLFIIAGSTIFNVSLESTIFRKTAISEVTPTKNLAPFFLLDPKNRDNNKVHIPKPYPLAPPKNTSSKDRMAWLQEHFQEFEIFKSTNLSRQFHGRVLGFFNEECEIKFFMIWISPAEYFGRREFLAMESVFKSHPYGCLMILSASMDSSQGYRILKPLIDCRFKVLAVTPDFPFLLENTPAKTWLDEMKSCKRDPGRIPLSQNLSNLMRLAVLYKYGGIYLDTDVLVLKNFKGLRNSIGAQSIEVHSKNWTRLNNAVLVFDKNHPLLYKFIEEFSSTFNGNKWGHNGPYLVTRVVQRVEGLPGYNFTVLPTVAFYPVNWIEIERLFKIPQSPDDSRWLESRLLEMNKECYGLHLWNKISRKFSIAKESAIETMIFNHCVICKGIQ